MSHEDSYRSRGLGTDYDPASVTTVDLKIIDGNRLHLIAFRGCIIIAQRTFNSSWDATSGAIALLDDVKAGASSGIAAVGHQSLRLFKGADGHLYVQHKKSMAGTALVVVPMATGEESWGRYASVRQSEE
jgi:hypothetical protein